SPMAIHPAHVHFLQRRIVSSLLTPCCLRSARRTAAARAPPADDGSPHAGAMSRRVSPQKLIISSPTASFVERSAVPPSCLSRRNSTAQRACHPSTGQASPP